MILVDDFHQPAERKGLVLVGQEHRLQALQFAQVLHALLIGLVVHPVGQFFERVAMHVGRAAERAKLAGDQQREDRGALSR